MGKALDGVKILDFTHVQSGPTCTQLLAWFGADVIKIERAGEGDITRGQLRDIPDVDSLYFTMLNHNKRSITVDAKHPKGKQVLEALVKTCDVLVENFAPGALDRMGLTWEHIQELNPKMIVASVKGFGPGPKPLIEATIIFGFNCWMRSQVNPIRSSAPGAKFSTSTSQCLTSASSTSLPFWFLVSRVIERLLWFSMVK